MRHNPHNKLDISVIAILKKTFLKTNHNTWIMKNMGTQSVYFRFTYLLMLVFVISCAGNRPQSIHPPETQQRRKAPPPKEFVLGTGDTIQINVWRNEDLKRTIKIGPSGKIYIPLVGEIEARGLTVTQLRKTLIKGFSDYIKNPYVDINLVSVTSQKIHILGEVNNPGTIIIQEPLRLWEVIANAGGFTTDANQEHVLIIHNDDNVVQTKIIALNLDDLFSNEISVQATYVNAGDIVYITETKLAGFEKF
ncbi:MAG: polysaccharide biosynthesis/export family protein, partial [Pseudomonadota bacterium]|nr:polysaccharide biosynthesis/export family protein [Pseudomonadota bacterium]